MNQIKFGFKKTIHTSESFVLARGIKLKEIKSFVIFLYFRRFAPA